MVFHAAALKHLPMLEQYPAEAVKTNVWGTLTVLEAAKAAGVQRFVNISTDKAANPTSVLGYSKRIAEGLTAAIAAEADGTYLSVRFGNVLGSRGSVLTAFAAQIAAGGPVTVTHPEVTRYFMTVDEAVQLVIQAAIAGRDGEALVLDMGSPVKIDDVARHLIELSGEEIDIEYTGLRDGEKMHEDLFSEGEPDSDRFIRSSRTSMCRRWRGPPSRRSTPVPRESRIGELQGVVNECQPGLDFPAVHEDRPLTRIQASADVAPDAELGEGTAIWHLAQVREGAVLGANCVVGRGAYVGPGVRMGDNCKLQNYALVYEPAVLEDGVFVGPAVVFTNDHYPRAVTPDGTLKRGDDWEAVGVTVSTRGVRSAPVRCASRR